MRAPSRLVFMLAVLISNVLSQAEMLLTGSTVPVRMDDVIVGRSSDSFRYTGVNMDFWPTTKQKWANSGALIVNLTQPSLRTLARGLSGSMLRLGGSPADFLLYEVNADACSQANLNKTQPQGHGYFCPIWDQAPGQCLTLGRWQEILEFAAASGLLLTMDLNACWGRESASLDMDWSLIDGLLAATAAARTTWGASLFAVEFGNEVYANIAPDVYGAAVKRLRTHLDELWAPPGPMPPRVAGPDCWENDLSTAYYESLLMAADGGLHALTFHDYGDSCCTPTQGNCLNVSCLDTFFSAASWVRDIGLNYNVTTWNGEGALHASSGISGLTNTAVSSLYYLHALGSYASLGFGLFSRQTLIGGDYELVNRTTFLPTPDYYSLLLFRKLVDGVALNMSVYPASDSVRAHAFCAFNVPGGVVALLINFSTKSGASVSVSWPTQPPAGQKGDLYTLQGVAGWIDGDGVLDLFRIALNNQTLVFLGGGELPPLTPSSVGLDLPILLPAQSATFVVWSGAAAASC